MLVPIASIKIQPKNQIRDLTNHDFTPLAEDIAKNGLRESLLVLDGILVSGYCRYYAIKQLGWDRVSIVTSLQEQLNERASR